MPQRMTTECVPTEQDDVGGEHNGTESDAEILVASVAVEEPLRLPGITREYQEENERGVQEVAVDILYAQRKKPLAAIMLPRLAYAAVGRIRPNALVIRAAI